MPLKVIGSGLGRTGTHSLKLALEKIGFGKCYHMVELFHNPEGLKYFKQAEKLQKVNWDELFTGYQSAVDYPVARYYKQLADYYPEAKVIHTVRDPETWYKSASETIFSAGNPTPKQLLRFAYLYPINKTVRKRFPVFMFNGKLLDHEFGKDLSDKKLVIKRFNEHNEEVIKTIPKNRLLIFNPKDGWGPLCEFLGSDVPSSPFPKSNTTEDFHQSVEIISRGKNLED